MTAQFQFFQSLPHKKTDFVKKKPVELGVVHKKLEPSLYLMVRYGMERFWNPLSVNWDMHGLKYISTIEVRNAFFSSQKETKSDTSMSL